MQFLVAPSLVISLGIGLVLELRDHVTDHLSNLGERIRRNRSSDLHQCLAVELVSTSNRELSSLVLTVGSHSGRATEHESCLLDKCWKMLVSGTRDSTTGDDLNRFTKSHNFFSSHLLTSLEAVCLESTLSSELTKVLLIFLLLILSFCKVATCVRRSRLVLVSSGGFLCALFLCGGD